MKNKIIITYEWWTDDNASKTIPSDVEEKLEESAEERIADQVSEGMTSGELLEEIDDIHYQGWWTRSTETE